MMRATVAILIGLALLTAACSKGNNDQKPPVYFVPPAAHSA
jgi:hypothetical protein